MIISLETPNHFTFYDDFYRIAIKFLHNSNVLMIGLIYTGFTQLRRNSPQRTQKAQSAFMVPQPPRRSLR